MSIWDWHTDRPAGPTVIPIGYGIHFKEYEKAKAPLLSRSWTLPSNAHRQTHSGLPLLRNGATLLTNQQRRACVESSHSL